MWDKGYLQVGEPDVTTVSALAAFGTLFCFTDPDDYRRAGGGGFLDQLLPFECTPAELADLVAQATGEGTG